MKRILVLASISLAISAGCGGTTVTAVGSGSGGSTTTKTTTTGTTTSGLTLSSSSSSSSSGSGACTGVPSWIDMAVDNGAPEHLTSWCPGSVWNPENSTTPFGYEFAVAELHVVGCGGVEGIELVATPATAPGAFTMGSAKYTDPMGGVWWTMPGSMFQVTVTKLGPLGDTIEGTFSAWTEQPNKQQAHPVTGSFHVCHVEDLLPP
jgi:hypothetical protein